MADLTKYGGVALMSRCLVGIIQLSPFGVRGALCPWGNHVSGGNCGITSPSIQASK